MIRWEEAETLMGQLEAVAARLGVPVRLEALGQEGDAAPTRGGLCRVKGEEFIYVDSRLSLPDKCRVLAEALSHFDLGNVFMPPAVRRFVERASAAEPQD
jgi:hypothetical protein